MVKSIRSHSIVDQITTETDKKFESVARMADVIVEMTSETGNCEQQDILAAGFTYHDVTTLWHFANALAAIELKCLKNGATASFGREVRYA